MQRSTIKSEFVFDPGGSASLDVMGPTIQFVTPPRPGEPCVMRGVIPPGSVIPIHSHPDPETFIQLSGEVEALAISNGDFAWMKLAAGSVFHVPGNVRHAFRNSSMEPSIAIVATTAQLGEFFTEIGRPIVSDTRAEPPAGEALIHFLETAERYGHWVGTPDDNAAVGIVLPNQ